MTKSSTLRKDVNDLQSQVRLQLSKAIDSCAEAVLPLLPNNGEDFTSQQYAQMRWEMLKAGFSHSEISGISSKIKAACLRGERPVDVSDLKIIVCTKYLEPIAEFTSVIMLILKKSDYSRRLAGNILNAHEKLVFLIGKQIDELADGQEPEVRAMIIKTIAEKSQCAEELIWRVATGGLRVPRVVLEKVNKVVRTLNAERWAEEEADSE